LILLPCGSSGSFPGARTRLVPRVGLPIESDVSARLALSGTRTHTHTHSGEPTHRRSETHTAFPFFCVKFSRFSCLFFLGLQQRLFAEMLLMWGLEINGFAILTLTSLIRFPIFAAYFRAALSLRMLLPTSANPRPRPPSGQRTWTSSERGCQLISCSWVRGQWSVGHGNAVAVVAVAESDQDPGYSGSKGRALLFCGRNNLVCCC